MKNKKSLAVALMVALLSIVSSLAHGAPGASNVNVVNTPNVNVVNTSNAPIMVSDVNTPGFQPISISIPYFTFGSPPISYTVPTGMVFVMEDVNAYFMTPLGATPPLLSVEGSNSGYHTYRRYGSNTQYSDQLHTYYTLHASTRVHYEAGTIVHISGLLFDKKSTGPGGGGYVIDTGAVSGYLINAPQ